MDVLFSWDVLLPSYSTVTPVYPRINPCHFKATGFWLLFLCQKSRQAQPLD